MGGFSFRLRLQAGVPVGETLALALQGSHSRRKAASADEVASIIDSRSWTSTWGSGVASSSEGPCRSCLAKTTSNSSSTAGLELEEGASGAGIGASVAVVFTAAALVIVAITAAASGAAAPSTGAPRYAVRPIIKPDSAGAPRNRRWNLSNARTWC